MITYKPLRDYLRLKNISYYRLKKDADVSQTVVGKILNDEYINLQSIAKICLYLKIPIEKAVQLKFQNIKTFDNECLQEVDNLREEMKKLKQELWKYQNMNRERRKRGKTYYIKDLKKYRLDKNLSLSDIAKRFDLTTQMIYIWETYKSGVSEKYISDLKDLLNIKDEDIVEWKIAKENNLTT